MNGEHKISKQDLKDMAIINSTLFAFDRQVEPRESSIYSIVIHKEDNIPIGYACALYMDTNDAMKCKSEDCLEIAYGVVYGRKNRDIEYTMCNKLIDTIKENKTISRVYMHREKFDIYMQHIIKNLGFDMDNKLIGLFGDVIYYMDLG